jgi:CreA protein
MKFFRAALGLALSGLVLTASAETVGSVDTVFKLIGPDHKIWSRYSTIPK